MAALHDILRELVNHSPLSADKRDELHQAVDDLEAKAAPAGMTPVVPVVTPEGA